MILVKAAGSAAREDRQKIAEQLTDPITEALGFGLDKRRGYSIFLLESHQYIGDFPYCLIVDCDWRSDLERNGLSIAAALFDAAVALGIGAMEVEICLDIGRRRFWVKAENRQNINARQLLPLSHHFPRG